MECQICATLETIRSDRIMKYVRLVEELKRSKSSQKSRAELQVVVSTIQIELDEAWKRLDAHRRVHAFGLGNIKECQYCGAETLSRDGDRPVCVQCAEDLEASRKPAK